MSERTRGTNTGDLDTLLELTHESVRQIAEGSGQSVNLVGWSLGGVHARETNRDHPDVVHRVAAFSTPLLGPCYTLGNRLFPEAELQRIEAMIDERSQRQIERSPHRDVQPQRRDRRLANLPQSPHARRGQRRGVELSRGRGRRPDGLTQPRPLVRPLNSTEPKRPQ